MADNLVVKAKVKEAVKGMNVSGDFVDALNSEVQDLVNKAVDRAEHNGRKTVQAKDL